MNLMSHKLFKLQSQRVAVLFLLATLDPSYGASPKNSVKLTDFIKVVSRCLQKKSANCLEKHITPDLNFPEHKTFGCQTERSGKVTPYEFALCGIKSKVKCTDLKPKISPMTLNAVLNECFLDSKSIGSDDQIITRSGYVCRLEDINHELFLSSVAIQDHLTNFEEDIENEGHHLQKKSGIKSDF